MNTNITSSWNASTWLATPRQAQTSLKKNIQAYKALSNRLKSKLEQLMQKRTELAGNAFIVVNETTPGPIKGATPTPRPPVDREVLRLELDSPVSSEIQRAPQSRFEESDYHHNDLSTLAATVTNILIESIEIRLSYIMETITFLTNLYHENPKQRTPPEFMLSRYEDWVQTNQRLFELNSRLYDLEKIKFDMQRREEQDSAQKKDEISYTTSQLVQSNALKIQSFLSRYQFPSHASSTTQTYLQEVLTQRSDKMTLEAQKVQEYVNECVQNSRADRDNITGAHPENYQQFMAVLCNFMVERQRELQGQHLPHSMVYSTVEHVVVPQIQSHILRYIQQEDRDVRIREQCEKFSEITQQQLNIKPAFCSTELEPFIDSISQLRATYFSPTPTDKMSRVVAAAKALYDQLSGMGEDSIDGDSFLDLWVYVTIKANIPDLATSIEFMHLYGNPALGMDEAGYYLTTLSVAANFIENRLADSELKKWNDSESFVVCEREKFQRLSQAKGSCFEVIKEREELRGYRVAVVKDWVLNKARLFCTALVPTGNESDTATVSVIRLSSETSSAPLVEYFAKRLTQSQLDLAALASQATPLGAAVTLNLEFIDESSYFILEGGDFDGTAAQITHVVQLIRLGSETSEQSCDIQQDQGFVYVQTPSEEDIDQTPAHQDHAVDQGGDDTNSASSGNTLPVPDIKIRSTSSSEAQPTHSPRASPSRSISNSPYLLSWSQREYSLDPLPPGTPPPQDGAELRDKASKTSSSKWRLTRKRTSSLKTSSKGTTVDTDGPRPLLDVPHVSITPSSSSDTDTPTPRQRATPKTSGGYQRLIGHYEEDTQSTTSDITRLASVDTSLDERLAKSENLGVFSPEDAQPLDRSRSTSFKKLKDGLLSRFSKRKHSSKKYGNSSFRNTLMVPFLQSQSDGQSSEGHRSKIRSKTTAALEERFVKPRERGSFVVVRLKSPSPEGFLDQAYLKRLEENFRLNHMFGSLTVDVEDSMGNIIRQGQMYLQHLNFLSLAVPIDGVFSDMTLAAVHQFQAAHNQYDFTYSSSLPEDGHLTSVTFQYLRQAFLTLYANMFRLGLLSQLGEGFDPTSTREEDVVAVRGCVRALQESHGLQCGHRGVLCGHTMALIRECLGRNRNNQSNTEL